MSKKDVIIISQDAALSMGIAHNRRGSFSHYGEFTEIASEMKKHAKYHRGSCYKIDKRQGAPSFL